MLVTPTHVFGTAFRRSDSVVPEFLSRLNTRPHVLLLTLQRCRCRQFRMTQGRCASLALPRVTVSSKPGGRGPPRESSLGAVQFTGPSLACPIARCFAAEVLAIGRTRPGVMTSCGPSKLASRIGAGRVISSVGSV